MSTGYNIVKIKTEKPQITNQGFLRCLVTATRTGVFPYIDETGKIRRELRLPEEVFKKESMQSLANVPFTDLHPGEAVHAFNATKYSKGLTDSEVKQNNDLLETALTIFDGPTIEKIINGTHEVSAGYNSVKEFTPGIYNGQPYDCIQRNIRYNHLALVPKGRANHGDHLKRVKLNLDNADDDISIEIENENQTQISNNDSQTTTEGKFSMKLILDGIEAEFTDANAALAVKNKMNLDAAKIEEEKKINADLKKQLDQITAQKDSLNINLDSLRKELEQLKSAPKLDEKVIQSLANELIEAREFVSKSSPKLNLDGLSCDEIKKSFLSEKFGRDSINEKSSDYISAAFDTFKKINHVSNADSDGKVVAQHKQSSNGDSISAAREAAMKRNLEAGRK
ncbi:MAG: DUF2213 domain-containing protein [Silvanigrellaceae bacterium]|nr:DUF2213 domain-containing protein [Silvanigrellaceae bacterium]